MQVNRQNTNPVGWGKSRRNHPITVATSGMPGVILPVFVSTMLRGDSMKGNVTVNVEMMETKELIMNGTKMRIQAHVVPFLAFERFEGSRDQFDRSFMGEPQVEGGSVVPFFETHVMGTHGSNAVYKALGLHGKETELVTTAQLEAYNLVAKHRLKNLSPDLAEKDTRDRLETSLAPALWDQGTFPHVVPNFSQAMMEGEVALNVVETQLTVAARGGTGGGNPVTVKHEGDGLNHTLGADAGNVYVNPSAGGGDETALYAEMEQNGVTISLANIRQATRLQVFAKLREKYSEHDDEWIIDMLMDGLTIPEQHLKQPVLIAEKIVNFGQAKRYAHDAGNLAESVVSGAASASLRLTVPKLDVGGIVIVTVEFFPERLFERRADPLFNIKAAADEVPGLTNLADALPHALRDAGDAEPVDIIRNGEIDTHHEDVSGTFAFGPMNWKWANQGKRIGGKFLRPLVDAGSDIARRRFWAVEVINAALSSAFYIVTGLHRKIFEDEVDDPFEVVVGGNLVFTGDTQFGPVLMEENGSYEAVKAKLPDDHIEQETE